MSNSNQLDEDFSSPSQADIQLIIPSSRFTQFAFLINFFLLDAYFFHIKLSEKFLLDCFESQ